MDTGKGGQNQPPQKESVSHPCTLHPGESNALDGPKDRPRAGERRNLPLKALEVRKPCSEEEKAEEVVNKSKRCLGTGRLQAGNEDGKEEARKAT